MRSISRSIIFLSSIFNIGLCLVRHGIFNLNANVDQENGVVDIAISSMVSKCAIDNLKPSIFSLVLNSRDGRCYKNQNSHNQPELFNQILSAMKECQADCNAISLDAPYINCAGERVLPMQIILNYRCTINWSNPVAIQLTTTATSRSTTRETTLLAESNFPHYTLEAVPADTTLGFLVATADDTRCSDRIYLEIDALHASYNRSVECNNGLFDVTNIETRLRELRTTTILISQPFCNSVGRAKSTELLIIYHCTNEELTTQETSSVMNTTMNEATSTEALASDSLEINSSTVSIIIDVSNTRTIKQSAIELDGKSMRPGHQDKRTTNKYNLDMILGIAIPLGLLIIILPIIVALVFRQRRRKTAKPLISQQSYQPNADNIYDNIGAGSAIGIYQDPSKFLAAGTKYGTSNLSYQGSLRSGSYSIYAEPVMISPMVGTGPPGTPSPIRDAVISNDYAYSEPCFQGSHDRTDSSASSCHTYDVPIAKAVRAEEVPYRPRGATATVTEGDSEKRISVPGYSHLTESHDHPYTAISTPWKDNDSIYHELENPMKLYNSPIYSSVDDVRQ